MKKLSEQFLDMSQQAATWESRAAARNNEMKKEYDADIAEARASEQAARADFETKLNGIKTSMSAQWREVQKSFDNQVASARSRAAQQKAAVDLTIAREQAYDADTYADIATKFAHVTAAEANQAMVEAAEAHAYAKYLEQTTPQKSAV